LSGKVQIYKADAEGLKTGGTQEITEYAVYGADSDVISDAASISGSAD